MNPKQTSDKDQNGGASGTKVTGLTPRKFASGCVDDPTPSATRPSGSSQDMHRGKQG